MKQRTRYAVVCCAVLLVSRAVCAQETRPFPGVRYQHRVGGGQDLHITYVDLCAAGVSARATRMSEARRTVVEFGNLVGAELVVNGNFYDPADWRRIDGFIIGNGERWGGTDHTYTGPVAFGTNRVAIINDDDTAGPQDWMQQAISGHPTLLSNGVVTPGLAGDYVLCPRHPRTLAGLTRDRRTLLLVVVDGRAAPRALGMTCDESAQLMQSLGAHDAVNLDGGGSSAMWMRGLGVVNRPSDGSLRSSVSHLAIHARGTGGPAHCPMTCTPRCDGTMLVDAYCGRGDCAVFGSRCVSDALGARCVFGACPATGSATVCLGTRRIVCRDGQIAEQGDCAAFGQECISEPSGARCGSQRCPATGSTMICTDATHIAECRGGAMGAPGDCAAFGQECVVRSTGARCGWRACPESGTTSICLDDGRIANCRDGVGTGVGNCAAFGAYCSTAGTTAARCVFAPCVGSPSMVPVAHDTCGIEPGQIFHCDNAGGVRVEQCAAGQQCSVAGGTVRCVPALCPTMGGGTLCVDQRTLGRCAYGNLVDSDRCPGEGVCTTAGGMAHCTAGVCLQTPGATPREHYICLSDERRLCDATGVLQDTARCAANERCVPDGDTARCVPTTTMDASVSDATTTDVQFIDAPLATDTTEIPDVRSTDTASDGGRTPAMGGCGCRTSTTQPSRSWLLLLSLLCVYRKQSRKRRAA